MKLLNFSTLLALNVARNSLAGNAPNSTLPTRQVAGLTVVSTPIVLAAEAYAKSFADPSTYAHIMRSWLYGVLAIQSHPDIYEDVDLEVHAVGALLHDLGLDRDPKSELVSDDKRFEIDGAMAARDFIRKHVDGAEWVERRVQNVWDAIALHTEVSIAAYKELNVRTIPMGISMDFQGPELGNVTEEAYAEIGKAFPKDGFFGVANETMIWLCERKPQTTIDTWIQPFGEAYVERYEVKGRRTFDHVFTELWP